jgi:peptide/nickel transport system substrate-binding protein
MKRWLAAPLIGVLALGSGVLAKTPDDTLVIAWALDPVITMDPGQIGEFNADEIANNICDSLVFTDYADSGKIVPGIAESWSVSADGRTVGFKIRQGLKHPSGNPVTAYDAEWSMRRIMIMNFANAATLRQWGLAVERVEQDIRATDERTLQVTFQRPYPEGLTLAAIFSGRLGTVIDKVEAMKNAKGDDQANGWLKTNSACIGPYRLRTWNANDVMILERNDGYWRGQPKLRRVIVRHVPESAAQRLQLEKGDVDIARILNASDLDGAIKHPDVRLREAAIQHLWYVAFNVSDPILGNPKVRQAFRHLIDNAELERTLMQNRGYARQSLVPMGAFGALPKDEGVPFKFDLARAKQLLTEAGHGGGFRKSLIHTANSPQLELAQYIQGNAEKVGIKLEIQQMAGAQTLGRIRAREYEIVLTGYGFSYADADAMVQLFAVNPDNRMDAKLTNLPSWIAAWSDPWFNDMADKARLERDPLKRVAMYHEIQRKHMAEGPFAFLTQSLRNLVTHKTIKDIKQNSFRVFYDTASK